MSDEYKKLSEEELLQSSGGVDKLASLGSGPVWKVKGLSAGTISLKSDPSQNSSEIAQLKNGDVVQATGGKIRISDDVSGKKAITYTQVYVPSLRQSGWIDSDYLG